jgi:hypothetical protein
MRPFRLPLLTLAALAGIVTIPSSVSAQGETYAWTGPDGGAWDSGLNWNNCHIPFPTPPECTIYPGWGHGDTAIFDDGDVVSLVGVIERLAAVVEVSGDVTMTGGALFVAYPFGPPLLDVGPGATLTLDGAYVRVDGLAVDATAEVTGSGTLNVRSTGTYDGAFSVNTLEVEALDGVVDFSAAEVTSPHLLNTGWNELVLDASAAPFLDTITLDTYPLGGGGIGFNSLAFTGVPGLFDLDAITIFDAGSVDFGGGGVAVEGVEMHGDTFDPRGLVGLGDLTLTGTMAWDGGTVAVGGLFTVPDDATVAITNHSRLLGALTNRGTFTHTQGRLNVDSLFVNEGTYAFEASFVHDVLGGDGVFVNEGVFQRAESAQVAVTLAFENEGTLRLDGGNLEVGTFGPFTNTGVITGDGTLDFQGDSVGGVLSPGASPGLITVDGPLTLTANAVYLCELAGLTPGTGHDQIAATGTATLGGTLRLRQLPGPFFPAVGHTFTVLTAASVSGTFATVQPPLGYTVSTAYNATSVVVTVTSVPSFDLVAANTSPLTVAPGGSVTFSYSVRNNTGASATGDLWYSAAGGSITGVIRSGTLPAGQAFSGVYTQNIPGNAPPGIYTYQLRIGQYPAPAVDTETFSITVTAAPRQAGGPDAWTVADATPWPGAEVVAAPAASSGTLPSSFALHAAAPNPFAARTTLRYDLPEAADVTVEVLDLLGRRVAVLVDGEAEAGSHAVTLDAAVLPSGVYLVRMTAGAFAAAQRVTLVR